MQEDVAQIYDNLKAAGSVKISEKQGKNASNLAPVEPDSDVLRLDCDLTDLATIEKSERTKFLHARQRLFFTDVTDRNNSSTSGIKSSGRVSLQRNGINISPWHSQFQHRVPIRQEQPRKRPIQVVNASEDNFLAKASHCAKPALQVAECRHRLPVLAVSSLKVERIARKKETPRRLRDLRTNPTFSSEPPSKRWSFHSESENPMLRSTTKVEGTDFAASSMPQEVEEKNPDSECTFEGFSLTVREKVNAPEAKLLPALRLAEKVVAARGPPSTEQQTGRSL